MSKLFMHLKMNSFLKFLEELSIYFGKNVNLLEIFIHLEKKPKHKTSFSQKFYIFNIASTVEVEEYRFYHYRNNTNLLVLLFK